MVSVIYLSIFFLAAIANACPPAQNTIRNEVHKVKLSSCGPAPAPLPVINGPHVVAPTVEQPPINLPANIPPAQTVAHQADCQKTVLKPQLYHQVIIVPYLQKFLKTCYRPVLETINYKSPLPLPPPEPLPALPPALPPCLPPAFPPCLPPAFPPCLPPPFPSCLPFPFCA